MEFFFFDPITYDRFYNCSAYSISNVPIDQRQKPLIGALTVALGFILTCAYLPCLFALSRPKLIVQPCYQLMFFLGIINIIEIFLTAICAGTWAILGTVFCSQPKTMFLHGILGTGFFYTELMTSCCLALNRLLNFYNVSLVERFFDGAKTKFWIFVFLLVTFAISFFNPPHVYTPIINSFVQNPHYGYLDITDKESEAFFFNSWSRYLSAAICCTTTLIYAAFLVVYILKQKQITTIAMNKNDKNIFFQVLWISLISFFVNLAYTFDREAASLPFGQYIVPMYTYGFIICQGSPPIIYLLLNKTIRSQLNLGKLFVVVHPLAVTNVRPSNNVVVIMPSSKLTYQPKINNFILN